MGRLGLSFDVLPPSGVDESEVRGLAFDTCAELARRKAEWVLAEVDDPDATVVGSDTVVALVRGAQERLLGKPADEDDARRMLQLLSGLTNRVLSGIAVARRGAPTRVEVEVSHVKFSVLSDEVIESYVETGDPLDKAGAYGIQSVGAGIVSEIRGCYYNIVGLPLTLLATMLDRELAPACDCGEHELQTSSGGCQIFDTDEDEEPEIETR
jgi:septum formation protein